MDSKPKSVNPKKPPGFRKNLRNYFNEFTKNTGIHGLKYLGEQDRSLTEKLYWLFLFCISLAFCTSFILKSWTRWEQSPDSAISVQSSIPLVQIPFPAVTICPEIKIRQKQYNLTTNFDKIDNYINGKSNITREELKNFLALSLICDNAESMLYGQNETMNFEIIDYLIKLAPPLDECLFICLFSIPFESCYEMFIPTLTEHGICYTFNMLDRSEIFTTAVHFDENYTAHGQISNGWTLENGYPKIPQYIHFQNEPYLRDLCHYVQGFKVILHNPNEVPRVNSYFLRVNLDQRTIITIKPEMTTTSSDMRIYDPHRRKCLFSNERHLKFFQMYSQQNCEIECIANYTLAKCGCAAYYMPREKSTPICGPDNKFCLLETDEELLLKEVEFTISDSEQRRNKNLSLNCDCLPSCTSITYDTEVSQSDLDLSKPIRETNLFLGLKDPSYHYSSLLFVFKDKEFNSSRKEKLYELFDLTDFIAACGGILSLFTGFSFLSIIEIFYFSSLRLICNIRRYGKHYWSGKENKN